MKKSKLKGGCREQAEEEEGGRQSRAMGKASRTGGASRQLYTVCVQQQRYSNMSSNTPIKGGAYSKR